MAKCKALMGSAAKGLKTFYRLCHWRLQFDAVEGVKAAKLSSMRHESKQSTNLLLVPVNLYSTLGLNMAGSNKDNFC